MGNKASKKKKINLDSELNKKISNILIINNNYEYSTKLRLNRSKTRIENNNSSNKLLENSNFKYRIRSKSKTREIKENEDHSLSKLNLEDLTKDDMNFLNLTNNILNQILTLNSPFNGNSLNYYNAYFYNNLYNEKKIQDSPIKNNDLKLSANSYRRHSSIFKGFENQAEFNINNINLIKRIFNVRKIMNKNLELEENLNNSQDNSFYMGNNLLNNSIINNLSSSFNIGDNSLIKMKSDSKLVRNSLSPKVENNLRNSDLEKENSQYLFNSSRDNLNYNNLDYFNENQSQITSGLPGGINNFKQTDANDKSIFDKSNLMKNSNYFNNEFDFYIEDELKNKKQREMEFTKNKNTDNSYYFTNNSPQNRSISNNKKPYKKRIYTNPPLIQVKMNIKDFIKDEVQEQSFYKLHPEFKNEEISNNKTLKNQTNLNNNNEFCYNNRDRLYDIKEITKLKLKNSHLNNRNFKDVIEKFSQAKGYNQKLNERKKLKDIDYNHARAKQREIYNYNNYDYSERENNETERINDKDKMNYNNISNEKIIKTNLKSKKIIKEQIKKESNYITKEIERDENLRHNLHVKSYKENNKQYSNFKNESSSRESSNNINIERKDSLKEKRKSNLKNKNMYGNEEDIEIEYSPQFAFKENYKNPNNHHPKCNDKKNKIKNEEEKIINYQNKKNEEIRKYITNKKEGNIYAHISYDSLSSENSIEKKKNYEKNIEKEKYRNKIKDESYEDS